jgi:hypothetical protein
MHALLVLLVRKSLARVPVDSGLCLLMNWSASSSVNVHFASILILRAVFTFYRQVLLLSETVNSVEERKNLTRSL